MSLKVWIDGKLLDKRRARIGVYDHGLLYGDGVFEGIRLYNGRVFELEAHLKRLYDSAKAIRLNIPMTAAAMGRAIEKTIAANRLRDCYIRVVVTRGQGYLGLNPHKCANPSVIIITDSIELYPPHMYKRGISIVTASVVRNHPNALSPRVKSLNYLNNILAKLEAEDAGAAEALLLNQEGNVAECSADNIFIVRDGRVLTPATTDGILEGITRRAVLDICFGMGIKAEERTLQRHDLYLADECFLTGTGAEVVPVVSVDARKVGRGRVGPVTRRLMKAFKALVRGE